MIAANRSKMPISATTKPTWDKRNTALNSPMMFIKSASAIRRSPDPARIANIAAKLRGASKAAKPLLVESKGVTVLLLCVPAMD